MDKFPLILTFLSKKVQLSGWNCSPFWDDDTDIEASFSKSFQTLLGISGLSSICCVTSSNKPYKLFLVDVLRMEFLTIFLEESPFFNKTFTEKTTAELHPSCLSPSPATRKSRFAMFGKPKFQHCLMPLKKQ